MEIRIYFEGNKGLKSGFDAFFNELQAQARAAGSTVELIAAKDGPKDYGKGIRSHPYAWNILLKDSEQAIPPRPVDLCERHGIDSKFSDSIFWMVELMEAWFLADSKALANYYGNGFVSNAIGNTADIERIPKADVKDRLKRATRNTTKGQYHKVRHAPFLLERLDNRLVQDRSNQCRLLFNSVRAKLAG